MSFKIDRLLDEEFKFKYREFYRVTRLAIFSDGLKCSFNVRFNIVSGLQVVSQINSSQPNYLTLGSWQSILNYSLFKSIQWNPSFSSKTKVEMLSELFKSIKIPIFWTEDIPVMVSSSKEGFISLKEIMTGKISKEISDKFTDSEIQGTADEKKTFIEFPADFPYYFKKRIIKPMVNIQSVSR